MAKKWQTRVWSGRATCPNVLLLCCLHHWRALTGSSASVTLIPMSLHLWPGCLLASSTFFHVHIILRFSFSCPHCFIFLLESLIVVCFSPSFSQYFPFLTIFSMFFASYSIFMFTRFFFFFCVFF